MVVLHHVCGAGDCPRVQKVHDALRVPSRGCDKNRRRLILRAPTENQGATQQEPARKLSGDCREHDASTHGVHRFKVRSRCEERLRGGDVPAVSGVVQRRPAILRKQSVEIPHKQVVVQAGRRGACASQQQRADL